MLASMSFPSSIRFQLKPYPNKHDFFNNDHYQHDNLVLALQHFPKHIVVKYYSLTSFFFFRYRPQCPFLLQHLGEQRIEHERRYAVFYPNEIELGADGMWRQLTSNSPSSRSSPNETDEDNDSILAQTTSSAEISVSEDDSDSEQNTCCQRCRCCICWVAAKNCIFFMRPHGNLFRMQQKIGKMLHMPSLYFSLLCIFQQLNVFLNIFLGSCYTKTFLITMFDNKTVNMNNNSHEKCWFFRCVNF